MPSTYTLNNGIELIATGEQSGTWGDTTNTNLSLVDTALDGQVTVTLPSAGTSGSPNTLAISDGAASDGRNRMVIFNDGGDLGATAYVQLTPNDAEKIIYVRNDLAGSRSIILFQGTYNASNDYELPAGTTAVIYFDGAGSGAVAANVFNNAYFDSLRLGSVSVTEIIDDDTMATAAATNIATSESIKAYVDAQVGANNELSEVLANGNTTGGTDISVSSGDDITFADSSKAIFGAGSDLQIYHDGATSLIDDTGTGNLAIKTNGGGILLLSNDENLASFVSDGAVNLYYDNAEKLATESGGVNITGTLTSDGLTVDGGVNVNHNTITQTANSPRIDMMEADVADKNARIWQTAGNLRIYSISDDTLTYSERIRLDHATGDITFYDTSGNASFVYDESAGSTFNEQGDNKDFRVESTSYSHMLFVDASSDNVVVGRSGGASNTGGLFQVGSNISGTVFSSTTAVISNPTTMASAAGSAYRILQLAQNTGNSTALSFSGIRESTGSTFETSAFEVTLDVDNSNNIRRFQKWSYPNGNVFNDSSSSTIDFRVESDTSTHALFVDAGSSEVGINNDTPDAALHVKTTAQNVALFDSSDATSTQFFVRNSNAVTGTYTVLGFAPANDISGAYIQCEAQEDFSVSANRTANMQFYTRDNGTFHNRLYLDDDNTVINEVGRSTDFRVESDGNTHMLFVDASENAVSIGSSSTSTASRLRASTSAVSSGNSIVLIDSANDGNVAGNHLRISSARGDTSAYNLLTIDNAAGEILNISGNGSVVFNEAGADRDFRIESNGEANFFLINANDETLCINTNLTSSQDVETGGPSAPMTIKNGLNVFRNLSASGSDRNIINIDSGGSWSASGNDGTTSNLRWSNGPSNSMGVIGLQFGSTTSGGQSEFVIKDMYQSGFGASGTVAVFGSGKYSKFMGGITVNEDGLNQDFRVESSVYSDNFSVDGGNGNVYVANRFGVGKTAAGEAQSTGSGYYFVPGTGGYYSHIQTANTANFMTYYNRIGTSLGGFLNFVVNDSGVGTITSNGSSTSYNTTSDHRLKENVVDLTGATERLKQLKPKRFNFINNADAGTVDGFLAHEAQTVVPEAVHGTHNEVDAEGNPVYQGIDQSKLVPLLVATIKELEARITALENV